MLTGGASTRMGEDKALLVVAGAPMAARVAEALHASGIDEVICVGGALTALASHGLEVIADDHPGEGPLGGIVTALRWAAARGATGVVVAPCDLLAPSATALAATRARAGAAAVALPVVGGASQPLHGAYRVEALASLEAAFADGERSVKRALRRLAVDELHDLDPGAMADADTPEDLAAER